MLRRRCTIVTPNPTSNSGGVERFSNLLGDVLGAEGWEVIFVGPATTPIKKVWRLVGLDALITSIRAAKAVRGTAPDLVVTNGYLGLGMRPVPRIHVFHGSMVPHVLRGARGMKRRHVATQLVGFALAESLCARRAAVKVAVSETAAYEIGRYYRLQVDFILPNGVDTDVFKPGERASARKRLGLPDSEPLALFVGRPEQRKGVDLLKPACEVAGIQLVVAGPKAVESAIHLGDLDPVRLADAYVAANCVLFPTRYEACSFVVLESLASGTPLITTRVGWMKTFLSAVPEYLALIVNPEVDDIAAKLKVVMNGGASADVLEAGRRFVLAENDLAAFGKRWREVIRQMDMATGAPVARA